MKLQIKWDLMWSFGPIHVSNECRQMKRAGDNENAANKIKKKKVYEKIN